MRDPYDRLRSALEPGRARPRATPSEPFYELTTVGADETARRIYWTLRETLEGGGMGPLAASRVALRATRGLVLELAGLQQREAAEALEVTARQARIDRSLIRSLPRESLDDQRPPIPRPADRITIRSAA